MFIIGMLTIDVNFLVCFGKSEVSMYCQLVQPFLHFGFCHIFINILGYKVVGGGIAMAFSNLITYFILQVALKRTLGFAEEALMVRWNDPRNFG